VKSSWVWTRLALSVFGVAISVYLTIVHYVAGVQVACPRTGLIDCAQVLTSPQSVVLGLPLGVWGLVWFVVFGVLAWAASRGDGDGGAILLRRIWAALGAAAVVYFIYLELLVIGKICIWCTAVHVLVLALLVFEAAGVE